MSERDKASQVIVRNTRPDDFDALTEISRLIYPNNIPWEAHELASHLRLFPEGQFVAVEEDTGRVMGMASSLIVAWDDYEITDSWEDFTDIGMFTNHDPEHGRTLYGAEVMVAPNMQGRGIGSKLYAAREELVRKLGLLRIRAGSRLRHYHKFAGELTPLQYVRKIVRGEIRDPTLSFQLKHGFHVLAVVPDYIQLDPASMGYAAVIEWLNPEMASPEDYERRMARFQVDEETSDTS